MKRERDEAEAEAKAAAELERRRNLTDEERKKEDEEFAKQRVDYGQEKAKWKFLQKYYHKGAYFQASSRSSFSSPRPSPRQPSATSHRPSAIGDQGCHLRVVAISAINIAGGFAVTFRMLAMFQSSDKAKP